ncbi:chemotaxis protein CheW, partial [Escherichia coli]|nr:chemotaxis protein CheW [Escherichia coli]
VSEVIQTEVAQVEAVEVVPEIEQDIAIEQQTETQLETEASSAIPNTWEGTQRSEDFQVLYFDVNEVTFAVPLDELGGIHRITELNHLIGRPAWYLGLQTNREQQFDVVDTAKWVMADKLRGDEYKDNYQYVVMLGESMWGLASNQ